MARGSKQWWRVSKILMNKACRKSSLPALRENQSWIKEPSDKAELLREHFILSWNDPSLVDNVYSVLPSSDFMADTLIPLRQRKLSKFLKEVDISSATSPDSLSSRVFKELRCVLMVPLLILCRSILQFRSRPTIWKKHWVFPLFKKKNPHDKRNYRGLHLTSQLSKIIERFFAGMFMPAIMSRNRFGSNQFAYQDGVGARDAVLYLLTSWISLLSQGFRIGVYCSDVSGAFDKVNSQRLIARLRACGIHPRLVDVMIDWLHGRSGQVIVEGCESNAFCLQNMVFQGTTWGPRFWNIFFREALSVLRNMGYTEVGFADDLNVFRSLARSVSNSGPRARPTNYSKERINRGELPMT